MPRVDIKLRESDKQIQDRISKALRSGLDEHIVRAAQKSVAPIRRLFRTAMLAAPEVQSLSNGKLQQEFGLPDGRARIERIIDLWANNIVVRPKKSISKGGKVSGGFQLGVVDATYSDVLNDQAAVFTTSKGASLPWLEWLLKFGDRAIIRDYEVRTTPNGRGSRTGTVIMAQAPGKRWRVPPEFAGTPRNNFVTRVIDQIEPQIINIMQRNMGV